MVHVMQIRQKIHWNEVNIMAPDPDDHGGLVEKQKLGQVLYLWYPLSTTYPLMAADKNGKNLRLPSNTDAYISAHKTQEVTSGSEWWSASPNQLAHHVVSAPKIEV